jgi:alkylation response protein AidB-like acyl-CoA dehydrogenase
MAISHANSRVTFGEPLVNRQAIQRMIADSAVKIQATQYMTYLNFPRPKSL